MVITKEIYTMVLCYSNKISRRKWGQEYAEDLAQDVIVNLLLYNTKVDYLSSFIHHVVRNAYINKNKSHVVNKEVHVEYVSRMPTNDFIDTSKLVKADFSKLLDYLVNKPKTKAILQLLIDNPDESYTDLAKEHGINHDTFKANVLHLRKDLKSVLPNY